MAYIGRPLQVANLAVQSGTGDGSDTTPIATLDYATTTNGIAVYLDGVRQLAGTDFNVTAQTTLTFTTAPANGVGIDVYFLGLELSIPTPADATVAKGKITTTLINEHVDTTITAADSILFSDSTDSNANKKDTVQGILDLAGVTDAKFLATSNGASNVTGTGSGYKILFHNEIYDTASAFASQHTFTAPETGKYLLAGAVTVTGVTTAADWAEITIVTSNRTYRIQPLNTNALANTQWSEGFALIADMDASDTVYVDVTIAGESGVVCDVAAAEYTYFSGALLA
jgi:hypothetical protein